MISAYRVLAVLLAAASFYSYTSVSYAQQEGVGAEKAEPVAKGVVGDGDPSAAGEEKLAAKGKEAEKTDPLDPVSGTVPLSDVPFFDFYERRVRYINSDKAFRNSIEARRVAFEQPNTDASNTADDKISEIYRKENDRSQAQPQGQRVASAPPAVKNPPPPPKVKEPVDNRPIVPMGEPGDGMDQAPEMLKEQEEAKAAQTATDAVGTEGKEKPAIKEIPVEETEEMGEPTKKIVVPEDAPDFSKSPL